MSSDSMESQFSCAALPDLRSGQSSRLPPPRRGSTRSAARLRCPCRSPVRRDAAPPTTAEGALAPNSIAFDVRAESCGGAIRCGGPPGLGGDVYHGARSLTLVTTTCLETVVPVNGGTFAMTIFRYPATAHLLERLPWTAKLTQSTIPVTRRLTPLSHDTCLRDQLRQSVVETVRR